MIRSTISFLLLLVIGTCQAQTYAVESVPNTKLITNSYVSNPDTIISEAAVIRIDGILSNLESQTTAQVAVVVIHSIGTADIFEFAQQLFDKWGVGRSGKDNGLLILLVFDQRTVRFHTGYGVEGILTDAMCKRIQMERMVPLFKEDKYDEGMIAGIEEVASILSNPEYANELLDETRKEESGWSAFLIVALIVGGITFLIWFLILQLSGSFSDSRKVRKVKDLYPEMRIKRWEWIVVFGLVPFGLLFGFNSAAFETDNHILVFLLILYAYFILALLFKRLRMNKVVDRLMEKKDYYGTVEFFREYQSFWIFSAILFPFPMLLILFHYLGRKKFYRNHPRDCKSCNKPLRKLDEVTDDQHLQKGQLMEEQLKSVDYDVWLCEICQSTEVWNYINRFSKYDPCPKCKTRTFFKESDRTITSPTYTSTGTGQITKRCKFCNNVDVSTYTIAKRTPPSSSSSGSGSSGGGSWGGGSSGGGGASSSW